MEKTNRRRSQRRRPRNSAKIECRKGAFGLGPNVATAALDVSDSGARLIVKETMDLACEVEIIINAYGIRKPIRRVALVRWQLELAEGGYCIGAEFQKRIDYRDWQNLAAQNQ
jgi:hypothetical protein